MSETRSPYAGCAIFIAVGLTFVFVLSFGIYSLVKMDGEIRGFTELSAKPTPLYPVADFPTKKAALESRLQPLAALTTSSQSPEAEIRLSAEDLNAAIASYDEFSELRQKFYVQSIEPDHLKIQISYPLNGRPMSKEKYFLNAQLKAIPKLLDNQVVLEVSEINIPGKSVPAPFLERFSPLRLFERYVEDPKIGPAMKRLSEIHLESGHVILKASTQKAQTGDSPNEVTPYLGRAFALLAVFLLIFFTVLFLSKRRKNAAS